jgi:monoamine oxidase
MKFVTGECMDTRDFDVIVIGAGAAGLTGALEIGRTGRKVAIVEARSRIGGRIMTILPSDIPIELGAEFIHGNLPLTKALLENAGAGINAVKGRIWQKKEGAFREQEDFLEDYKNLEEKLRAMMRDKTVASFLEEDLHGNEYPDLKSSLRNYVEGYYAADMERASTFAVREEFFRDEEEQYRPAGGYRQLIDHLHQECLKIGVEIFLSKPVLELHWQRGSATAVTEQEIFRGQKALLTVPIGVLQKERICFKPALPAVNKAAGSLGYGHVIKVILVFDRAFWQEQPHMSHDLTDLGFLFTGEEIPTWWTQFPTQYPVLTGWLGGPKAEALHHLKEEEMVEKAITSLGKALQKDVVQLHHMLVSWHFHNWSTDPYAEGAYSYEVVGGSQISKQLLQPVENTLFFAGEGLHQGPQIGTVEGALASGREVSHRLIGCFDSENIV